MLDHRLRRQRPEGGAAGLRLHPAGRVRPDEHLRRAGWRPDQIRRCDRRHLHRHAGVQFHPGRAQRPPSYRQAARRSKSRSIDVARHAGQCRFERAGLGQGRRALRQRPSEHRALHDLSRCRWHDRAGGRQRRPVRPHRRGARPSGMGRRSALCDQSRAGGEPRYGRRDWSARRSPRDRPKRGSASSRRPACLAARSIRWPARWPIRTPRPAAWSRRSSIRPLASLKMLGIPFRFSDTRDAVRRAPPTLGQHTDEILRDELGLGDDAIAKLRARQGSIIGGMIPKSGNRFLRRDPCSTRVNVPAP